ncbi:hypothetical protein ABEB36_012855 [Hypothenemus hampei]|uniref:ZSWIM3 N-terminal domain-containing protein n=1 Tax=Hypothenemus hampei TaxID=57062 RepID=A0ABD1E8R0_HYPHA
MAFFIGQIFKTFEEVSSAMEQYEAKTFAKYWKRDARLITSSRIKKTLRPELKYYEVKFCCIFGGQKFRKTGNNIKEIRTFKKEDLCPAFVAFRVSENGKFLEVKEHYVSKTDNFLLKKLLKFLPRTEISPTFESVQLQDLLNRTGFTKNAYKIFIQGNTKIAKFAEMDVLLENFDIGFSKRTE